MSRPTITDVAQGAGVSKSSVSFAYNNPSRIALSTRERILDVAKDLGYVPDPVARSMSSGRTGTIGMLLPQPMADMARNPYLLEFLAGLAKATEPQELPILLVSPLQGSMERAVYSAAVDGFLTLGLESFRPTIQLIEQRHLPYVMVDSEPIDGIACVNADDTGGAYQAMRKVLDAGHRNIGILGITSGKRGKWHQYKGTLARRMAGYHQAFQETGLNIDTVEFTECAVSELGGRRGLQRILDSDQHVTAVVAMSDIIALGALEEAANRGLTVPQDLSIVGFDGLPESRWSQPPLTTVTQPTQDKGRIAGELLIGLVAGTRKAEHIVLDTQLVSRGSLGPPPPTAAKSH